MMLDIAKCSQNPIVRPGKFSWRKATVFNPAAIYHNDTFYIIERAAASLAPHVCVFGLLQSSDGVHFTHVVDKPVFTAQELGYPYGSVQDPRIVRMDGTFYMTYALRRFTGNASGYGNEQNLQYFTAQGEDPRPEKNNTISGIAVSDDLIHWENLGFCEPLDVDDRDLVLFPRKIKGKYAMLRRPFPGNSGMPAITIACADSLKDGGSWHDAEILIEPVASRDWQSVKTGAAGPPIETPEGWLTLYHAVGPDSIYRVGAAMLDLENPQKVIARTTMPFMEPDAPCERLGAVFRNVVFPCGNVVKDGTLYVYYGAGDTSICLATVTLQKLVDHVMLYQLQPDIEKEFAAIHRRGLSVSLAS